MATINQLKSFTVFGNATVGDVLNAYLCDDRDKGWQVLISQVGKVNDMSPINAAAIIQTRWNDSALFTIDSHDNWLYDTHLYLYKDKLYIRLLWDVYREES